MSAAAGTDAPIGSIGSVLPGVELRLVDDDGDDALVGDSGEIWVRGPNVFAGYWNDPAATATALTADGWLRTGDIGVVDDDGYVYLVDRAKDLIIVSGFNVYPAEVEEVLAAAPGGGRGRGHRRGPPPHGRGGQGLRGGRAGTLGRRGRHHRLLPRPAGPLQVPVQGDVRRRATAQPHREAPASFPPLRARARRPASRAPPRSGRGARASGSTASRNPAKITAMPTTSDTEKAFMASTWS